MIFKSMCTSDVPDAAVKLFGSLMCYADQDGICWPSLATLMEHMGGSKNRTLRAMKWLEAEGYLVKIDKRSPSGTNRYRLADPRTGLTVDAEGSTNGTTDRVPPTEPVPSTEQAKVHQRNLGNGSTNGTGSMNGTTKVPPAEPLGFHERNLGGSTNGTQTRLTELNPENETPRRERESASADNESPLGEIRSAEPLPPSPDSLRSKPEQTDAPEAKPEPVTASQRHWAQTNAQSRSGVVHVDAKPAGSFVGAALASMASQTPSEIAQRAQGVLNPVKPGEGMPFDVLRESINHAYKMVTGYPLAIMPPGPWQDQLPAILNEIPGITPDDHAQALANFLRSKSATAGATRLLGWWPEHAMAFCVKAMDENAPDPRMSGKGQTYAEVEAAQKAAEDRQRAEAARVESERRELEERAREDEEDRERNRKLEAEAAALGISVEEHVKRTRDAMFAKIKAAVGR